MAAVTGSRKFLNGAKLLYLNPELAQIVTVGYYNDHFNLYSVLFKEYLKFLNRL